MDRLYERNQRYAKKHTNLWCKKLIDYYAVACQEIKRATGPQRQRTW